MNLFLLFVAGFLDAIMAGLIIPGLVFPINCLLRRARFNGYTASVFLVGFSVIRTFFFGWPHVALGRSLGWSLIIHLRNRFEAGRADWKPFGTDSWGRRLGLLAAWVTGYLFVSFVNFSMLNGALDTAMTQAELAFGKKDYRKVVEVTRTAQVILRDLDGYTVPNSRESKLYRQILLSYAATGQKKEAEFLNSVYAKRYPEDAAQNQKRLDKALKK